MPNPAAEGLKVPVIDVPGPDQSPPISAAINWTAGSVVQKGPTGVIVPFGGPV